ncbi:MAG: Regulatory protein MsrR [Chloroflexi bacterium ADurb.Bin325]|nr:MAG: Regulatory protein MsrR [Chloroflexi bacterium ADurb.Bin325]
MHITQTSVRRTILFLLLLALLAGCGPRGRQPQPTITPIVVAAATDEPTATATHEPTAVPATATASATATHTPTATATATVTLTPTVEVTGTATATPTFDPSAPLRLEQTQNFLVLGADVRPGPWMMHTDSIMLVAIDKAAGQVGVLSIPRDLWVEIPNWGADRLNSAYFLGSYTDYPGGSPALAKRVVEETLGVPVHHVVLIKMDGLAQLVDALDGVTVHLDCPLYEQTPDPKDPNRLINWTLPAGDVQLDGATARKFATYRYITTDFGRAQRQQQLIWAIRDRASSLSILPRIPELWTALSGTFETDLSLLDVVGLARLGLGLKAEDVHGAALDRDVVEPFVTKGGASVLRFKDQMALRKRLSELFDARPLSALGRSDPTACPPKPPGF